MMSLKLGKMLCVIANEAAGTTTKIANSSVGIRRHLRSNEQRMCCSAVVLGQKIAPESFPNENFIGSRERWFFANIDRFAFTDGDIFC